ncbi:PEP-CTERM sorting domain-containing protein [Roseateles sp. NT4]|uniref:PEP-CTERM sorting domain-containing protein n=1 Tax=Roseateles sp. NT4 TaxID=3453715 RepID=UPI003EE9F190
MRAVIAIGLSAALSTSVWAEESGPPSPPQQPQLPGGVSISGNSFAYPNGNVVQGGIANGQIYTFGGGLGTPYNGQLASWGDASSSLAQIQGLLTPDASIYASATQVTRGRSEAGGALGYRVLLVASDQAAADDLNARIANGDFLASVNGRWNLTADGWAYSSASAVTGASVPGLGASQMASAHQSCGSYGVEATPTTPGCGGGSFSLPIYFAPTAGMVGGDSLSFVSTISLYASANAGTAGATFTPYPGVASAFVDPTVTLANGVHGTLILGDNGNVANPIPEPASWALMLAGAAGLLAWRRRTAR